MKEPKGCKRCFIEFIPYHQGNSFCSKDCRLSWYAENQPTHPCVTCGKQIAGSAKYCKRTGCRPGSRAGHKNSKEHNEAIASAHIGKTHSNETRERISHSLLKSPMFPRGSRHYKWNQDREAQERKRLHGKTVRGFIGRMLTMKPWTLSADDVVLSELGYSPRQLMDHLEGLFADGMSWDNYGVRGWHIDHIRPISSFPEGTPVSVINELTNLRPLWARENLSKGGKWDAKPSETHDSQVP